MKKIIKNSIALGFGLLIAVFILEVFLRLFNPFGFRIKGNSIVLPANQKYTFHNNDIPGLDSNIIHTKNSLGFRGPEKPKIFDSSLSIITIGGSTTECFYINDGKTWPELLANKLNTKFKNIWVNNAGLDGHSSFGHQLLLTDYIVKIKPKVALFLVGCNDVALDNLTRDDKWSLTKNQGFLTHFEIYNTWMGFKRAKIASKKGIGHHALKIELLKKILFDSLAEKKLFDSITKFYLPNYSNRINKLISVCKNAGIYPVFISQPTLAGSEKINGINALDAECGGWRAQFYARILDVYNQCVKEVCMSNNVGFVNSSDLNKKEDCFYDFFHFNNEGCKVLSNAIFPQLSTLLMNKFPNFEK